MSPLPPLPLLPFSWRVRGISDRARRPDWQTRTSEHCLPLILRRTRTFGHPLPPFPLFSPGPRSPEPLPFLRPKRFPSDRGRRPEWRTRTLTFSPRLHPFPSFSPAARRGGHRPLCRRQRRGRSSSTRLREDEEVWLGRRFDENKKTKYRHQLTLTGSRLLTPHDRSGIASPWRGLMPSLPSSLETIGRADKEWDADICEVMIFCK